MEHVGFTQFLIYLAAAIASVIMAALYIRRRKWEELSVPAVVFFMSIIGLGCDYPAFVRVFSGLYDISFFF